MTDDDFLRAMNIQPCDITRPIPFDWTESDVRMATVQRSEMEMLLQSERHCVSRQSEIIANQVAQIEELEEKLSAAQKWAEKWRMIGCTLAVAGSGLLVAVIMLAKELVRK